MTRFARAKGSKSSNEKKPEDATPWSEMKKSVLSKPSKEPEQSTTKPEVKKEVSKQTEWGSLGDDNSVSLLKKNITKNKKKKEKLVNSTGDEKLGSEGNVKIKKKVKRKKPQEGPGKEVAGSPQGEGDLVGKKIKKRKLNEETVEVQSKKKKKVDNDEKINQKKIEKKFREKTNVKNGEINKKFKNKFEKKGKFDKKFNKRKDIERNKMNKKWGKNSDGGSFVVDELIINGEKIPIVKFQGFNVTLEDAERLKKLRLDMIKEGIPKNKLEAAIKLERRRAEKALARLKKAVCFHCRGYGHLLSNCPNLTEKQNTSTGVCYKCGSTEHSSNDCKVVRGTNYQFAECFICKEQGHIARQCPDNPKGLYPQGGACRECGDVTHLRKDCPQVISKKVEETVTVGVRNDRNLECLDEEIVNREKKNMKKQKNKNTTVVF